MTLEEAYKIIQIWGEYLEYAHSRLCYIFLAQIPESFLPFPAKTIEGAINMVAEHHHKLGNQDAVTVVQSTMPFLIGYVDDKEALLQATKSFSDPKFNEAILPAIKNFHNNLVKMQEDL